MADYREQSTDPAVKLSGVAAATTDQALVVALSPNSPLPTSAPPSTFSATVSGLALAAAATDVFAITGSATKTIKITKVALSAIKTTASQVTVVLLMRSTANSFGTSMLWGSMVWGSMVWGGSFKVVAVPYDSATAAATAVTTAYAANTTTGTLIGNIYTQMVFVPSSGTASYAKGLMVEYGNFGQQNIVLRGIAQQFSVNLAGQSVVGGSANISIEWTEV